jgi:2-hydroxy-6-oxonona-2,4-dienedioate hydrolase
MSARPVAVTLAVLALALCIGGLWVAREFRRDMTEAYQRIQGRSQRVASPFGDIEFLRGGGSWSAPAGPPVLVIHGSGGGFDQGELLAQAALGKDTPLGWIAPSRFGYLGSGFAGHPWPPGDSGSHAGEQPGTPVPGAGFDEQAHAYAFLLDRLGITRVAVVALSHGGPSALLFAALHPTRVSSLTLISAGVASSSAAGQAGADDKGSALTFVFQQDFRYWALTQLARGWFLGLMGADAALVAGLSAVQRQQVDALITGMNPVSPRAAGVRFDNQAAMPNERIAVIRAPTLVLHARDDGLQLFHNAEFAARHIPGARLVAFDRGGHLLLAVAQAEVQQQVLAHVLQHAGPAP